MTGGGSAERTPQPQLLVAGRYRLVSPLGGGAMGSVWLARDQRLNRPVAVKHVLTSIEPAGQNTDERRRHAVREGRMAAQLSHPHSVSVYDVAVDAGEPWLVMEYLPSRSLAALVLADGPLPPVVVAQLGAQLADALGAAHDAGVIHRDVKPGNVLIGAQGRDVGVVKIADFGVARSYDETPEAAGTSTDLITGTPEYFAPEVARGQEPTAASDVYSLGATLYAAVEGSAPFGLIDDTGDREQTRAMLRRVAAGQVEPPEHAGIVASTILSMMEPDPQNRPVMAVARDALIDIAARGRRRDAVLSARLILGPAAPAGSSPPSLHPSSAPARRPGSRSAVHLGVAVAGFVLLLVLMVVAVAWL